jgi:hypothetical protein
MMLKKIVVINNSRHNKIKILPAFPQIFISLTRHCYLHHKVLVTVLPSKNTDIFFRFFVEEALLPAPQGAGDRASPARKQSFSSDSSSKRHCYLHHKVLVTVLPQQEIIQSSNTRVPNLHSR